MAFVGATVPQVIDFHLLTITAILITIDLRFTEIYLSGIEFIVTLPVLQGFKFTFLQSVGFHITESLPVTIEHSMTFTLLFPIAYHYMTSVVPQQLKKRLISLTKSLS